MASPEPSVRSRYPNVSNATPDRSNLGRGSPGFPSSPGQVSHSIPSNAPSERSEPPRRVQVTSNASNNLNQSRNINPEIMANYPAGPRSTVTGHGQVDRTLNYNNFNTGTGATPTPTVINSGYMQHGQHPGPAGSRRYPEFLSFPETLYLQLSWAYSGLKDGLRLDRVIRILVADAEIRAQMLKSFLLNLLCLCSIYVFDLILLPLLHKRAAASSLTSTSTLYQFLWVLPVMGGSLYLNGIWSTNIAEKVYTLHNGRRHAAGPTTYLGFLSSIASSAYRVILIVTSITVSFALTYIPLVGKTLSFVFVCWIDSYYCFEFVWQAKGMSLAVRVKYLEERWAYFLAFGLPITAICVSGNSLANTAIFALIFPAYIILAIYANPVPPHPYSPAPPVINAATGESSYPFPSPLVPTRLPIFAIVIWINGWVIYAIDVLTGGKTKKPPGHSSQASQSFELRKRRDVDEEFVESGMPVLPSRDSIDRAQGQTQARHRVKTHLD